MSEGCASLHWHPSWRLVVEAADVIVVATPVVCECWSVGQVWFTQLNAGQDEPFLFNKRVVCREIVFHWQF